MIYSIQREPLRKSLPTVIDRSYGIQTYDQDNIYPQRVDEVRVSSYTAKSAVDRYAEFIDGEGWEDQVLANLIFNAEGMTGNDVLDFIAQDKAPFTGFALHFKYNPFTYRIMEVTPVEFMYCRLGLPDSNGNVSEIVYSRNWEMDFRKTTELTVDIECFPVYNPDPTAVKAQIDEYGWDQYPGQILYWTPKPGVYPKSRIHSVLDDAQAQSELSVYKLSNIQNKWTTETIIDYPGTFEDDAKRKQFQDRIAEHKGSRGSGTMVIENPTGAPLQVVKNLEVQNTDKLFEFTTKDIKNAIRESLALPAEVMGVMPEGGMFNKSQIEEAYTYTNAMTQGDRSHIERVFKKFIPYWNTPVQVSSFRILPQSYFGSAATPSTAPATPGQPGQAPVEKPEFNAALAGLTGKQSQNLRRIQRQFDREQITKSQAINEMKISFGLTDEQASSLLDDDPTNDAV